MNPSRRTGLAALFTVAEKAGTIASSIGSANAAPRPRRNVRLGSAIFVIIMTVVSASEMEGC